MNRHSSGKQCHYKQKEHDKTGEREPYQEATSERQGQPGQRIVERKLEDT